MVASDGNGKWEMYILPIWLGLPGKQHSWGTIGRGSNLYASEWQQFGFEKHGKPHQSPNLHSITLTQIGSRVLKSSDFMIFPKLFKLEIDNKNSQIKLKELDLTGMYNNIF